MASSAGPGQFLERTDEHRAAIDHGDARSLSRGARDCIDGSGDQFRVGADTKSLGFHKETDQTYGDTLHTSEMATPGHGTHPQFDHDLVWQWGMRVPIIAAINGACAGIAASLASFRDPRYAAEGIKFTTSAPRSRTRSA